MSEQGWDNWYDKQRDVNDALDKNVAAALAGESERFAVALWSAIIEHAAETMRRHIPEVNLASRYPDGCVCHYSGAEVLGCPIHGKVVLTNGSEVTDE